MPSVSSVTRSLRNVSRVAEVTRALVKYGFDDLLVATGLDTLVDRSRRLLGLRSEHEHLIRQPQSERVRMMLEELGPTAVKIGQVLSTRPDLIPPEWANEFRKLQDDVPPISWEEIKPHIEEQYDRPLDEIFEWIEEEPLAAASMAQVHRAKLKSGESVVLKILRPNIHRAIQDDIDLMRTLAHLAEDHFTDLGYSPRHVVDEFARDLEREMDLTREGRSCERLAQAFEDNEFVSFPRIYWSATSGDVLVMEEIKGRRLSRIDKNELTHEEREKIVAHGTHAVFYQCFELGFFHADPHPGNIMVREDGGICFIDCGMTGSLEPRAVMQLADLVYGTLTGDLETVVDSAVKLGDADPLLAQDRAFRTDAWEFINRFRNANFSQIKLGKTLDDFFNRIRRHNITLPSDLIFMIKAMGTIEGVGEDLDPDFDIAGCVEPLIRNFVKKRHGLRALRKRLMRNIRNFADLTEDLPDYTRTLMQVFQRNQFTVNLEHHGLQELEQTLDQVAGDISNALVLASLVVSGSMLMLAAATYQGEWGRVVLTVLGIIIYLVAAMMGITRFFIRRFRR